MVLFCRTRMFLTTSNWPWYFSLVAVHRACVSILSKRGVGAGPTFDREDLCVEKAESSKCQKSKMLNGGLETEMLGDYRPGYSLWKRKMADFTVIVIQGEGGELLEEDVLDGFRMMKKTIQESSRYITFYDLTDCMQNLWPHAPALIRFAMEVRQYSVERQTAIVCVCPDEKVRNWVRWILGVAASSTSYHIFRSCSEAWVFVDSVGASQPSRAGVDAFGAEAALPSSLSSLDSQSLFGSGFDQSFLAGLL